MENDAQILAVGDRVRYESRSHEGVVTYREGLVVTTARGGFVDVQTDSGYLVGIHIRNLEKLPAKE